MLRVSTGFVVAVGLITMASGSVLSLSTFDLLEEQPGVTYVAEQSPRVGYAVVEAGDCAGCEITPIIIYLWDYDQGPDLLQPVMVAGCWEHPLISAVQAWIAGVPDQGLYSGLGSYPRLLTAGMDGDVAVLDFDGGFLEFRGGSGWASAVVVSLTYTVTEVPGVRAVRVLVEGQPAFMHAWVWSEAEHRDSVGSYFRLLHTVRYAMPLPATR